LGKKFREEGGELLWCLNPEAGTSHRRRGMTVFVVVPLYYFIN